MLSSITNKINETLNINNNNTDNLYEFLFIFKKQKLEKRLELSRNIFFKYPDRIPIIIDSKETTLDKNKYICPSNLTVGQFLYMLKKKIKITSEETIFLISNNNLLQVSHTMAQVYSHNKDEDDFLYIVIATENAFGN
jgi:GABA(A) receptor-associated protein